MTALTVNNMGMQELTMTELDLVAGGWDWGRVNWGRAAAIGTATAVGGGIAGASGGPVGAGLGAVGGFVGGFGAAVISNAW
ncbi:MULTISPECIES: hypothetical protein [unclassified Neisseria]|uniref:hypothetical protein n=1 Tax=unclassified Neisseria TaxID=2623750 RepID=UPI001072EB8F|nr:MULTISPECIES: hypothetical protein [unclassified Neisseria]MBF0803770.1 hypothetical protein [Neisseria sp. 19428wB4_WF04]TFU43518.1 hypothetical protein E4T99_05295 [Neisseria sp. WF04]